MILESLALGMKTVFAVSLASVFSSVKMGQKIPLSKCLLCFLHLPCFLHSHIYCFISAMIDSLGGRSLQTTLPEFPCQLVGFWLLPKRDTGGDQRLKEERGNNSRLSSCGGLHFMQWLVPQLQPLLMVLASYL